MRAAANLYQEQDLKSSNDHRQHHNNILQARICGDDLADTDRRPRLVSLSAEDVTLSQEILDSE
jgi:hypothetical protein